MGAAKTLKPPKYKNYNVIPDNERENHLYTVACNLLFRFGNCQYAREKLHSENKKCSQPLKDKEIDDIFLKALHNWYEKDILPNPLYIKPINSDTNVTKWGEPRKISEVTAPKFPVGAFPRTLAEFINAVSEFSETSAEMCGVLLLGALGGVFQRKYEVISTAGNSETLSIFSVVIAEPAERKSSVIRKVITPFSDFEKEYNEEHRLDFSKNNAEKKVLTKQLAEAEKGNDGDEIIAAQAEFDFFVEKFPLSLLSDDTTPEAIVLKMKQQGERTIVTASEGGFFKRLKGRYTPNGDDKEIYLKAHSGDRHSVDRVGRPSNVLDNPAISIIMSVQKCIVEDFVNSPEMNETGMSARFVYAFCAEKAGNGRQPVRSKSLEEFEYIFMKYNNVIKQSLSSTIDRKELLKLNLSNGAFNVACSYFYKCEERIKNGSPNAKSWNGKAFGLSIRIAGLFHCFQCFEENTEPSSVNIHENLMANAAFIVDCLAIHAEKVFSPYDKQNCDAKYLLERIRREIDKRGNVSFSKTELIRLTHGHFKKVEDLIPALTLLEDYGYISTNFLQTGGRPTEKIEVNPQIKV